MPHGDPQSDAPETPDGPGKSSPIWLRLSGAGIELAFITIAFGAAGTLIDGRTQAEQPVAAAFGGLIGFTLGMVRFLRLATSISQQQRRIETGSLKEEESPEDELPTP